MTKRITGYIVTVFAATFLMLGGGASALSLSGFSINTSPQTTLTATSQAADPAYPCLQFSNHQYEVCTAYVANSSLAVSWPYYAHAKSPNTTLARYVTYRLGSRYTGQAYSQMVNRVASWPPGDHDVSIPTITIMSVNSSLQTNSATLVTRENWKISTQTGKIIYQEVNRMHTVSMQRVPSYVLHKWVVTNYQ